MPAWPRGGAGGGEDGGTQRPSRIYPFSNAFSKARRLVASKRQKMIRSTDWLASAKDRAARMLISAARSSGKPKTPVEIAGTATTLRPELLGALQGGAYRGGEQHLLAEVSPAPDGSHGVDDPARLELARPGDDRIPDAQPPIRSHSSWIVSPPTRRIDPATPAKRCNGSLAALTIASRGDRRDVTPGQLDRGAHGGSASASGPAAP